MPDQVGVSHSALHLASNLFRKPAFRYCDWRWFWQRMPYGCVHGYDVTLIDRRAIGGRAQVFERGGFRHDVGPTVITAPFLFDELLLYLASAARIMSNFVRLTLVSIYFHTGEQFDYRPSIEDTNEIRRFSPQDVAGYAKLLKCQNQFLKLALKNWPTSLLPNSLRCWHKYQACYDYKVIIRLPVSSINISNTLCCGRRFRSTPCLSEAILLVQHPFTA